MPEEISFSGGCSVKRLCLPLLVLLWPILLRAQVVEAGRTGDTLRLHGFTLSGSALVPDGGMLRIPPLLLPEGVFQPSPFPGLPPGVQSSFLVGPLAPKVDLLSPYLLQRQQESRLSTLYMVLGAAGLGGAAYIGYRHVKKYGFYP
jgi:hypothetical protein